eukprot:TRINITY_DN16388_c0_g1_i1.p1 TRINITY_DN16388_c0_g1~~TRINITY_DN16388_c0_g1_i1.p1  ORF type:complete len:640 (-),score=79.14 TRINITY_DN16388_c0_g1_i1:149-2068(-)
MGELALRFLLGTASVLVLALASAATEESSCAAGQGCAAEDDHNALLQWNTRPPCEGKTCGDDCVDWSTYRSGKCSSEGTCLTTGEAPVCEQRHYCKRDLADYTCYKNGHPQCCSDGAKGSCPEQKPQCELPYVCQEKEHLPCACTGTVYFGKKYAQGTPGYGEAIPLASLQRLGEFVTKQVAREITCSSYGFHSDPAYGKYKRCICVPDQASDVGRDVKPPTPAPPPPAPVAVPYKLMKRAGCTGGNKTSYQFIEDPNECAKAGKSLGLGDGQTRWIQDKWRPYGCYVAGKSAILYFNGNGSKRTRSSSYPSICMRAADPCKKKVCGQTCVIGDDMSDMAGICTAEGKCSVDYGNVNCGSFKMMSGGTCEQGFQYVESKEECRTAAFALGLEPKVGTANSTKTPYGCYKYLRKDTGAPRIMFNSQGTKNCKARDRWSICAKSVAAPTAPGPCESKACGSTCSGHGIGITAVAACDVAGKCSSFLSDLKCEMSDSNVLVGVTSFWVHDDFDKDSWWNDKGDVYAEVRCEQDSLTWKSKVFHNTLEGDFKLYFYADKKCGHLKLDIKDKDDNGSETIMSTVVDLDKQGGVRVKSKARSCDVFGSCNVHLATDVTYYVYQGYSAQSMLRRLGAEGVTPTPAV